MRQISVAVIGAGASGLICLHHFSAKPSIFKVKAFEKNTTVGGAWIYSDAGINAEYDKESSSSMYKNLKTNLPKEIMAIPGFPFDSSLPSFISRDDVLQYLINFAEKQNLMQFIKFKTTVECVSRIEPKELNSPSKWTVKTKSANNEIESEDFDAVIVCNGHFSKPYIPDIPGLSSYSGRVLHSNSYRDPQDFKDQEVLVLGVGPSGKDIGLDLSTAAKQVYLSHNKAPLQTRLPSNVHQVSGVARLDGNTVQLHDHTRMRVDTLLLCTGYRYDLPFIHPSCGVRIEADGRGGVAPLHHHLLHTQHHTLAFIGLCTTICPFPMFDRQARYVAAVLSGDKPPPTVEHMIATRLRDQSERCEEFGAAVAEDPRHAHRMATLQWRYNERLAREAGASQLTPVTEQIYLEVTRARRETLLTYKEINYHIINDDTFEQCV